MKITDDLFELVQSLSQSEKGYFKKFALRHSPGLDSNYLKLFKEIDKQVQTGKYNEELIKKKLKPEKFSKNFPVTKVYLYESILRSLSFYYSHSTKNIELREAMKYIEILYRKTLYKKCLKLLEKVKQEAIKYDNLHLQLEIFRWEKNLIRKGRNRDNSFEALQRVSEEETMCLTRLKNLGEFATLGCRANRFIKKSEGNEIRKNILSLLSHPLLKEYNPDYTYLERLNFYHLRSVLSNFLGDTKLAYSYQKQLISGMESDPLKLKENLLNYIIGTYNLLLLCIDLKYFDELNDKLKNFRNIPIPASEGFSENLKVLIFFFSSILELKMYVDSKNFNRGLNILNDINEKLKKYKEKIGYKDMFEIYSYISLIYFGAGNYDQALAYNNKIVNEKNGSVATETMIVARLYNMIIHYELNNISLLHYELKSTCRFLKSAGKLNEPKSIIIDFLKKGAGIQDKKKLLLHFQFYKDKFEKIKNKNINLPLLGQFDINYYLENKIRSLQ